MPRSHTAENSHKASNSLRPENNTGRSEKHAPCLFRPMANLCVFVTHAHCSKEVFLPLIHGDAPTIIVKIMRQK